MVFRLIYTLFATSKNAHNISDQAFKTDWKTWAYCPTTKLVINKTQVSQSVLLMQHVAASKTGRCQ